MYFIWYNNIAFISLCSEPQFELISNALLGSRILLFRALSHRFILHCLLPNLALSLISLSVWLLRQPLRQFLTAGSFSPLPPKDFFLFLALLSYSFASLQLLAYKLLATSRDPQKQDLSSSLSLPLLLSWQAFILSPFPLTITSRSLLSKLSATYNTLTQRENYCGIFLKHEKRWQFGWAALSANES